MTSRILLLCFYGFCSLPLWAAASAPKAKQKPQLLKSHGITRTDPYYWLRERDNKEVVQHLEAENAYTDAMMAETKDLQTQLFSEFKSRIAPVEESAPYAFQGHLYYSRQLEAQNYPVYYRKKIGDKSAEETVLDSNTLAQGHKTFIMGRIVPSPDDRYLAYAVDTEGSLSHTIHVLERATKKSVLSISDATGEFAWASDSKTLVFTLFEKSRMSSKWVYRQSLSETKKTLIYEEKDPEFYVYLYKSSNGRSIFLHTRSTTSDEAYVLNANAIQKKPDLFLKRQKDLRYELEDAGDRYYILTNHKAKNYQVMECLKRKCALSDWTSVVAADDASMRQGIHVFRDVLVVEERQDNTPRLRIVTRKDGLSRFVPFADKDFLLRPYNNFDYEAKTFLYRYESLISPPGVYSYDFASGEQKLIREREVPGYKKDNYETHRLLAKSRDGVLIPISIVHKKGLSKTGKNPLFIYGYGAYGINSDPRFSPSTFSLLDRGFIYAIAHVRGSSTLGQSWYEDGKLLKKKNSFYDFIDATEFLVAEKYADPTQIYAYGRSAGGLLMGALATMRPDLYRGLIPQVPFVDVLTDMEDPSLPLVTEEYQEWGNPADKTFYDYMRSYSPYDTVEKKAYPSMFLTGNFNDTQVMYWEPAKFAQKLRDHNTGPHAILLRTDMSSGHSGSSGRYDALKEYAEIYAFVLGVQKGLIP